MAFSNDIKLPRHVVPRWPNRCVRCGAVDPERQVKFWTHSIGWWTLVTWSFGWPFSARVPACAGCAWKLRFTRWMSYLVMWGVLIVGLYFALQILSSYQGPFKRLLATGIAFGGLLPMLLMQVIFPPPFDFTCYAKTVEYEFRDQRYAIEFASVNINDVIIDRGPEDGSESESVG